MQKNSTVPLPNHPLYKGGDVDECREILSGLYSEVTVEPPTPNGPFAAVVNGLYLQRSAVCYTAFAHGMRGGPTQPTDFHTIQLAISGAIEFKTGHGTVHGDSRTAVMLSPDQRITVHPSPGNACLSYIVKDAVLRDVVCAWTGLARLPPIRFQPRVDLSGPRNASFVSLLQHFVDENDRPGGILESRPAVASFEQTLMTFLLFGLEHSLSDTLRKPSAAAGTEQVRQVEEYIEAHALEPIDMNVLARVTGQSASAIYRAFRRHRDYTPMQFLRDVRMRIVRQRLMLAPPSESVTRIATQCGFMHLGRFAVEYRRRFGESPSATLNRTGRKSA